MARFRDAASLRSHLASLPAPLPLDDMALSAAEGSPLATPIELGGRTVGNRFAIHPMEGWDASQRGEPTDILLRRWQSFGASGAKLIWGGEAVAVVPEGRANPRRLGAPACVPLPHGASRDTSCGSTTDAALVAPAEPAASSISPHSCLRLRPLHTNRLLLLGQVQGR